MFKINKESFFFAALILVAITLPFSNLLVNTMSIWSMIFFWIINSPIKEKIQLLKSNKLVWLFVSLFLINVIGLIYGDLKLGMFEVEKKLSLLIFPVVLGTSSQISSKRLKAIFISFAISCIAIGLICLVNTFYTNYSQGITLNNVHLNNNYTWRFSYLNLTKDFGIHPSYFSMYAVFSIFILLCMLLKKKHVSKTIKFSLMASIIFLIILILFLASRIGIICLLILSLGSILVYYYKKQKLIYGIIATLLIISLMVYFLQFFSPISEKFKDLVYRGSENLPFRSFVRFDLWKSTLAVIKDNLLIGVGTGDLQPILQTIFKSSNYVESYQNHYNPHNQFLDTAATLGIIGFLVFSLGVFYPFYLSYKKKMYLYSIFILLFIFVCLVECPLAVQKGVVWYAFFNSLFAFHSLKKSTE